MRIRRASPRVATAATKKGRESHVDIFGISASDCHGPLGSFPPRQGVTDVTGTVRDVSSVRDVRAPLERGEAITLTVGAVLLAVSWCIVRAVEVPQCDLRARRESGSRGGQRRP